MPEGPEHYKSAQFINKCCEGRIFTGKVIKSEVNVKNPEVSFDVENYEIHAKSRGKELMLTLKETTHAPVNEQKPAVDKCDIKEEKDELQTEEKATITIVFQFGMSGCFRFTTSEDLHKHAHLMFHSVDGMVLSYVDVRRFGKWRISDTFSSDRGPDLVYEYEAFRKNVLEHLNQNIFQKSICEVLHNQKYFNGIGNYLRAEILYRAKIQPFVKAFDVLNGLEVTRKEPKRKKKNNEEAADFLEWCTLIPYEVMMLDGGGYDQTGEYAGYNVFEKWLRCYYNKSLNNLVDHDGRTIWFQGDPGPLVPMGNKAKSRHQSRKILAKKKAKPTSKPTSKYQERKKEKEQSKTLKQKNDPKPQVNSRKRKLINTPLKQSTPRKRTSNTSRAKEERAPVKATRRSARLNK